MHAKRCGCKCLLAADSCYGSPCPHIGWQPAALHGSYLPTHLFAGDLDLFDALCRALVHHSRAHVVSVGYKLAPEHQFPEGLEDAYAATCWVQQHAAEFGADPSRIAVAGE